MRVIECLSIANSSSVVASPINDCNISLVNMTDFAARRISDQGISLPVLFFFCFVFVCIVIFFLVDTKSIEIAHMVKHKKILLPVFLKMELLYLCT
uniref:Uncharacterized protein n=1 Tax=Octopus bimaculoides TaxID=37653 RepID=A0A0L8IA89_OCTBM